MITLKASDFDTKKQLLDAVRKRFHNSSMAFAPGLKNDEVQEYRRWVVSFYNKDVGIKVLQTQYFGPQQHSNYWLLNEEVCFLS